MNISTSEDIQHYMNVLQIDKRTGVIRSDTYNQEKNTKWVKVDDLLKLKDEYPIFGRLLEKELQKGSFKEDK